MNSKLNYNQQRAIECIKRSADDADALRELQLAEWYIQQEIKKIKSMDIAHAKDICIYELEGVN